MIHAEKKWRSEQYNQILGDPVNTYKDLRYVRGQIKSLAKQLKKRAKKHAPAWEYKGKNDVEMMYLLRDSGLLGSCRLAMSVMAKGEVKMKGKIVRDYKYAHGPVIDMSKDAPFVLEVTGYYGDNAVRVFNWGLDE